MPRSRSRSRSPERHRDRKRGRDAERRERGGRDEEGRGEGRSKRDEEERGEGRSKRGRAEPLDDGGGGGVMAPPPPRLASGAPRASPMDLDELVRRRNEQIAEQKKPVFLSKQQRAELALKRRAEEGATARAKIEAERKQRAAFVSAARGGGGGSGDQREQRQRERHREREASAQTKELDKQKEALKKQYLGGKKEKKKVLKPSEKFRFSFDWEANEDTSRDINPLYEKTVETQLLFGRGMRAGIDRVVQVKEGHKYLKEVQKQAEKSKLEALGQGSGDRSRRKSETQEERRERHKAEDKVRSERKKREDRYQDITNVSGTHWSEKPLADMDERDWRIFKEDFRISVKGGRCPKPVRNWEEAGLPPELLQAVRDVGYEKPSPIQMQALPIGLTNRDMIGLAETGSGKTCAFVLPMLTYIMKSCPELTPQIAAEGPFSLIMAPTRELVKQIEGETKKFARHLGYKVFSVVGGENINDQGVALRSGVHVLIATPGRLVDCLENRYIVLNQCNYIVLDEADRMIDMGFEPQVQAVLDAMPNSNTAEEGADEPETLVRTQKNMFRQTFLFSATMPPEVERLAKKYTRRPAIIQIGETGRVHDRIEQHVMVTSEAAKIKKLELALQDIDPPIIVFVNTRAASDVVSKKLDGMGFNSIMLHGGKMQAQREAAIEGFREGRYDVLVATNVAGRGIDIPDVQAVINYDMPNNIQDYTHRIGRTGRAGKKGLAISFLVLDKEMDKAIMYDLVQMLRATNSEVPSELAHHESAKTKPGQIEQKVRRSDEMVFAT